MHISVKYAQAAQYQYFGLQIYFEFLNDLNK